tara:strand:- start:686 stop:877 length:192 start_codon:yes stop_codon:yes gene_type:complete
MPLVGNVIFGEDNFGITQAQAYSKMSGHKIEPNPQIELVFKGSNFNEDEYFNYIEGSSTLKGE